MKKIFGTHHGLIPNGIAIDNYSEFADFALISTTRMTQIMWLDNLAHDHPWP